MIVDDIQHPSAPAGAFVGHLPQDVESSWQEARRSYAVGAYTAAVLMCRKLLMHMAVDHAGAKEGEYFAPCIKKLIDSGELPEKHKPALEKIRKAGGDGAHKLEAISEADAKITVVITQTCLRNLYEIPAQV